MQAKQTGHVSFNCIWLLESAEGTSRSWSVHPFEKTDAGWLTAGDSWQIPHSPTGLQRLHQRWQQAGQPQVALKIPAPLSAVMNHDSKGNSEVRESNNNNSNHNGNHNGNSNSNSNSRSVGQNSHPRGHWLAHDPGHWLHERTWPASTREISEYRLLCNAKVKGFAVCSVDAQAATGDSTERLIRLIPLGKDTQVPPHGWHQWLTWFPPTSTTAIAAAMALSSWLPLTELHSIGFGPGGTVASNEDARGAHAAKLQNPSLQTASDWIHGECGRMKTQLLNIIDPADLGPSPSQAETIPALAAVTEAEETQTQGQQKRRKAPGNTTSRKPKRERLTDDADQ